MANRDIAGLLTGIPTQKIDPITSMTPDQQRMHMGSQAVGQMVGGIRGMMGMGPTQEEQFASAMGNLDLNSPDGLRQLAKVQQVSGQFAQAAQTIQAAKKMETDSGIRESLTKIAESQGNTEMVEFLEGGGALSAAQGVLFRADRAPKTASLTDAERDEYDLYMGDYTDDELMAVGGREEGKLWGTNVDEKGMEKVRLKAEYIYTAGQAATREDALRMVITGDVPDGKQTPTPTQGGGTSKDPFANIR